MRAASISSSGSVAKNERIKKIENGDIEPMYTRINPGVVLSRPSRLTWRYSGMTSDVAGIANVLSNRM